MAPEDRKTCDEARGGEAKLTDAGRKVYGGDGITPDYCVEPETPSKFVAYLIAAAAFVGFARGFAAAETHGNARRHRGRGHALRGQRGQGHAWSAATSRWTTGR